MKIRSSIGLVKLKFYIILLQIIKFLFSPFFGFIFSLGVPFLILFSFDQLNPVTVISVIISHWIFWRIFLRSNAEFLKSWEDLSKSLTRLKKIYKHKRGR